MHNLLQENGTIDAVYMCFHSGVSIPVIRFRCLHSPCSDDLDRKLQAQATAEILSNSSHPVVMVSYITNKHGSRDYNTITSGGGVKVRGRDIT